MVGRHVRFGSAVLICPAVQPHMGTNAIPSKEHLHRIPGDAHIHLLANVFIRDRVVHLFYGDVVVRANCGDLPRRQLKRAGRQRLEERLLFLKQKRPAAVLLLERLVVELLQLFEDGLIQLTQRQELPVAQRCQDLGGDVFHGAFRGGLVIWPAYSRWDNRRSVMLRQLLVAADQHHFMIKKHKLGCRKTNTLLALNLFSSIVGRLEKPSHQSIEQKSAERNTVL